MVSLRGKTVEVTFYKVFSSVPIRKVVGKVTRIHTPRLTGDRSDIELVDVYGQRHTPDFNEYFVVTDLHPKPVQFDKGLAEYIRKKRLRKVL